MTNFEVDSGTFDDGGFTHTVTANWAKVGGTYAATGTINFIGSTGVAIFPSSNFNNVSMNFNSASNNLFVQADISVAGNWTNTQGTVNVTAGQTVTFNGTGAQTLATGGVGSSKNFAGFAVNKSSGTATLAGNLNTTGLTVTAGTFDQGASFTVTSGAVTVGASGIWNNTGTGDLTLSGGVSNSGTITFNANGTGCPDNDDIVIGSTGGQQAWSGTGTFNMTD